ncbi:topoisomerase DNA-binding C4 zinc finger domain-containing protein [Desulfothermobacter acidiphilus]|uniref:topoisomerase DNA-binding C4 zinc finger domain-containing protein n=1 Tax=Desulfothermobacter acidiphilus TaxID=1938353 RepID=UPI003F8B0CE1
MDFSLAAPSAGKTASPRRLVEELIAELGLQCPRCGEGKLCYRTSSRGPFLGCDRYPECRYTLDLQ